MSTVNMNKVRTQDRAFRLALSQATVRPQSGFDRLSNHSAVRESDSGPVRGNAMPPSGSVVSDAILYAVSCGYSESVAAETRYLTCCPPVLTLDHREIEENTSSLVL